MTKSQRDSGEQGRCLPVSIRGRSPGHDSGSQRPFRGYLQLAATVATEEIHRAFLGPFMEYKTFFHGHSYTGNALACAAACACLEVFETENTLEAIQPKIAFWPSALQRRLNPCLMLARVRQRGFMVGIELTEDRPTRADYPPELRMGARVDPECSETRCHSSAAW